MPYKGGPGGPGGPGGLEEGRCCNQSPKEEPGDEETNAAFYYVKDAEDE